MAAPGLGAAAVRGTFKSRPPCWAQAPGPCKPYFRRAGEPREFGWLHSTDKSSSMQIKYLDWLPRLDSSAVLICIHQVDPEAQSAAWRLVTVKADARRDRQPEYIVGGDNVQGREKSLGAMIFPRLAPEIKVCLCPSGVTKSPQQVT